MPDKMVVFAAVLSGFLFMAFAASENRRIVFHLTPQTYSFYYAANSAAAVAGPILYLQLTHRASNQAITRLIFAFSALSAILLYAFGAMGPLCFLLGFLPFTIVEAIIRPFAMDVLLNLSRRFIPVLLSHAPFFCRVHLVYYNQGHGFYGRGSGHAGIADRHR